MLLILIQAVVLLLVLGLIFYCIQMLINFLQLSRDVATIAGILLTLLWVIWLANAVGLLPPLPPAPVK